MSAADISPKTNLKASIQDIFHSNTTLAALLTIEAGTTIMNKISTMLTAIFISIIVLFLCYKLLLR
jgi:hypothetical protein